MQCPRGTAGTATLWNKGMDHLVEHLPDSSDMLLLTDIATTGAPILLINIYMPTERAANADYEELLAEVYELKGKYSSHACI